MAPAPILPRNRGGTPSALASPWVLLASASAPCTGPLPSAPTPDPEFCLGRLRSGLRFGSVSASATASAIHLSPTLRRVWWWLGGELPSLLLCPPHFGFYLGSLRICVGLGLGLFPDSAPRRPSFALGFGLRPLESASAFPRRPRPPAAHVSFGLGLFSLASAFVCVGLQPLRRPLFPRPPCLGLDVGPFLSPLGLRVGLPTSQKLAESHLLRWVPHLYFILGLGVGLLLPPRPRRRPLLIQPLPLFSRRPPYAPASTSFSFASAFHVGLGILPRPRRPASASAVHSRDNGGAEEKQLSFLLTATFSLSSLPPPF